jgi:hypothetical protein
MLNKPTTVDQEFHFIKNKITECPTNNIQYYGPSAYPGPDSIPGKR